MDNELEIVSNEGIAVAEEVAKESKFNQYLPVLGGTAIGLIGGAAIYCLVTKVIIPKITAKKNKPAEPSKDEKEADKA